MEAGKNKKLVIMGMTGTLKDKDIFSIEAEGFDVIRVETSKDLLQCTRNYPSIDTILFDGDQQTEDFQPIIQKIKTQLNYNPLLILTSHFRLGALANAVYSGFDEFLAKPVGEDELKALLNKYSPINK